MRILVIRLSSMGDVALTLPVLKAFREEYPDIELIMLTKPEFRAFFSGYKGIILITPELKYRHKGISGILRLFLDIRKTGDIDNVIDLHDVLRTKVLRFFFRLGGTPAYIIDKGRKEKRLLVSGRRKSELKHTVIRYAEVFRAAGFVISPVEGRCIVTGEKAKGKVSELLLGKRGLHIGIAPFARHELKQWPVEYMKALMEMISEKSEAWFWLFGGKEECARLSEMEKMDGRILSLCGKLTLEEEMAVMGALDFMVAMDSSNMHMAALSGTKVISIWVGTDPLAGFGAWGQPAEFSISISSEELKCRPCTVYGKGRCHRGDFACMLWLTPEKVFSRLVELKVI